MADVTARNVLFPIMFIAVFVFLFLYMPNEFVVGEVDYLEKDHPSFFTAQDIAQYKFIDNATLEYGEYNKLLELGTEASGYVKYIAHWYTHYNGLNYSFLKLEYVSWEVYIFGIPIRTVESCAWTGYINPTMSILPQYMAWDDLVDNTENGTVARFSCKSRSSPTVEVWITDENETRNNVLEAWQDEKILLTLAMGIDDFRSTLSSYDTLVRLLTFQEIQQIPIWISYPINIFIWGLTAYVLYCLILKAIPFLGD